MGKGGFAKCYEFKLLNSTPEETQVFAGKVVPKILLHKHSQREKMAQEIKLHRELKHKHVVKFINSFQCK